jgi:hypothetical protein
MDRNALFVETVKELSEIASNESASEYQLVKSSALMRTLLMDKSPLLHQVNRQRRRRVTFSASAEDAFVELAMGHDPLIWFWLEAISPRLAFRANIRAEELTLDQWLAKRGGVVNKVDVTVKELILQVAHVEGGVHAGTPRTEIEHLMKEVSEGLLIGGFSSVTRTMRGIAEVVSHALVPLCPPGTVPAPAGSGT